MATFRMLWRVATLFAMLMTGATSQLYDEGPLRSVGPDALFQEGTYFDAVPHAHEQTSEDADKDVLGQTDGERALLLLKIIQALRMRNENTRLYQRAIPESLDYVDAVQSAPDGEQPADGKALLVAKRLNGGAEPTATAKPTSSTTPQGRWKANKGTHIICYFKLCSIRAFR
ncbi:unnamed protein product, partial [Iphiclides podalirius]